MKKHERIIYYFGEQDEVNESLSTFFSKLDPDFFDFQVVTFKTRNDFIKGMISKRPFLVIFDFCLSEVIQEITCDLIRHFRAMASFKHVAFAGIFKNKQQLAKYNSLYALGVQYAFFKGEDIKQALHNLYYITFEDESYFPKYARAKRFELECSLSSISMVASIDEFNIVVDMEVEPQDEEVELALSLYDDFKATLFPLLESYSNGMHYNTFYSQKIEIPFAGGWDDDEELVQRDTYNTWFNLNSEQFNYYVTDVLIISRDFELFEQTLSVKEGYPNIRFVFRETYDASLKEVFKFNIGLILINITDDNSYEAFNSVMSEFTHQVDVNPIVIALNHNSTSEALKKLFSYDLIISWQNSISSDQLKSLVEKLLGHNQEVKAHTFYYNDPRGVCGTKINAKITSVTENDLTFKTDIELPLYSVLKVDIPIQMYLLVIPPTLDLSINLNGYHYMTLIMGVNSDDRNYLRMYVNKLMRDPPDEWKYLPVNNMHGEDVEVEEEKEEEKEEASKASEKTSENLENGKKGRDLGESGTKSHTRNKSRSKKSKL